MTTGPESAEAAALDHLSYRQDGPFGGPYDVYINGERIKSVRQIQVVHGDLEFSEVTIVIGGVSVELNPSKEHSASDSADGTS